MEAKCPMCGAPMEDGRCGYCGYVEKKIDETKANVNNISQQSIQPQTLQPETVSNNSASNSLDSTIGVSTKSRIIAWILCIFLGYFGVHRFYVGDSKMGKLYLCTFGVLGIGWIIDIILIATGSFKDGMGLPLRQ